jgi:hypothetical protein
MTDVFNLSLFRSMVATLNPDVLSLARHDWFSPFLLVILALDEHNRR